MEISTVDLRRRTGEVIAALRRGETIRLRYRGRDTAVIEPVLGASGPIRVQDHALFGSRPADESVATLMDRLRAPRYAAGRDDAD